mmetsp:Transcript_15031/g.23411  ORF Transcript_15031/g.23411 Transcript_15031/m.23411 type:complete len:402 (-) Transcript_15031:276-1481(-)
MDVLNAEEFSHIVAWRPDGESFAILKPREFCEEILPLHWKKVKYMSFLRKLHRWGFTCDQTENGRKVDVFTHKFFKREKTELVDKMKPTPAPTTAGKQAIQSHSVMMQKASSYATNAGVVQSFHPSSNGMMLPRNLDRFQRPQPVFSANPNSGIGNGNGMPVAHGILPRPDANLPPSVPATAGRHVSSGDPSMVEMAVELEVTRRLRESVSQIAAIRIQEQQHAAIEEGMIERERKMRLEARLDQETRLRAEHAMRLQVERELQAQHHVRQDHLGSVASLSSLDGIGHPRSELPSRRHKEIMQEVLIGLEQRTSHANAATTNVFPTHEPFPSSLPLEASRPFPSSHSSQLEQQARLDAMAAATLSRNAPTNRRTLGYDKSVAGLSREAQLALMMGEMRHLR